MVRQENKKKKGARIKIGINETEGKILREVF